METRTLINDYTQGSVPRQLLRFSTPLFFSNLFQVLYNMVDMAVVGAVCGAAGLSAVSVGGDVTNFLTLVAMGFSGAAQVIVSQLVGASRHNRLGRFIGNTASLLLLASIVLSIAGIFLRVPILRLMNTPAESYDQALAYSTVCMAGLAFIYGYNIVSAVLRGLGDAKHPFLFISIAAGLNIVLDLLFVAGLGLGAMGAALATVLGQAVSFVVSVIFLFRRRGALGFTISGTDFVRPDRELIGMLLRLGVPMAIKNGSVHVTKLFVNSHINAYGVTVSAVAGIANKIGSMMVLCSNSVNSAGSTMVGQNIGARKYERVTKILVYTFLYVFLIALVFSLIMLLCPNVLFGIFTSDPEVLAVCLEWQLIGIVAFGGSVARAPANALINGSGNYKLNFAIALLDGYVMRIGLALLFGISFGMGYRGFWLGDALAGYTPFLICSVFYLTGKWKTDRYVAKG